MRVQAFTADPLALADYNPLTGSDGKAYRLLSLRPQGDMLVARVEGVATREAAEALSGVELSAPRDRLPPPEDEDEFLMADLVGCEVRRADGSLVGRIVDVANYGAGDLLDIRPAKGGATVLMPFTKAFAPKVDVAARVVTIDPPAGLFED